MKTSSFMETYFNFEKVKEIDFLQATKETLYMTVISMILVILIGFTIGLLLFYLNRKDTLGHKIMYQVVSIVSSVCRSIPFIILMILIIPFTKALLGTFLGTQAAIPALVISAAPFYGRMVEIALREVDQGVLEAAESMGASTVQIITKVLIPESKPALISGITVTNDYDDWLYRYGGCYWCWWIRWTCILSRLLATKYDGNDVRNHFNLSLSFYDSIFR